MTKNEFIKNLSDMLSGLDETDIQKSIEFYSEIIDDSIEDGVSEDEAIEALGNINDVVEQIRCDVLKQDGIFEEKSKNSENKRKLPVWAIILIIFISPILLGILAGLMGMYVALWSVIAALYAADVSIFVYGLCGIFVFPFNSDLLPQALIMVGLSLGAVGISILLFFGMNQVTKYTIIATKRLFIKLKLIFKGVI